MLGYRTAAKVAIKRDRSRKCAPLREVKRLEKKCVDRVSSDTDRKNGVASLGLYLVNKGDKLAIGPMPRVSGKALRMDLDTIAAGSVISYSSMKKLLKI